MNQRRSLDDTCHIFLSRRRVRSSLAVQRTASEFHHHAPALRMENIRIPPYFLPPKAFETPELPATVPASVSAKPLPLPGSSGAVQAKPVRLPNGRRHIPRPRNPFILFRCDLVHQRKELPRSDLDDTNISRIAGDLWREMTIAQKKPWVELAAKEKARHALLYPDYKYTPTHSGLKSKKTRNNNAHLRARPQRQVSRMGASSPPAHEKPRRQPERSRPYPQCIPRRRSSSCPPVGAVPVSSHSQLEGWAPTCSQDDMQRHPSRTIMYQSAIPQPAVGPTVPPPAGCNPLLSPQGLDWLNFPPAHPLPMDSTDALPDLNQNPAPYAAPNCHFFDYKPIFSSDAGNPGLTLEELKNMELLAVETAFTDPFSILATIPVDNDFPCTFSTALSPFDCSGYSTGPPPTPAPGTPSSN